MRHDYRCAACGQITEVTHMMRESPRVSCPNCGGTTYKVISVPQIQFNRYAGRSTRQPDRPSNKEYQAYLKWEAAGGEPNTQEHKEYLASREGK